MSGSSTGAKLAEQLKFVADEKHRAKHHAEFGSLFNQIISESEKAAAEGRYEYTLYDDKLKDASLLSELKRSLKDQGFKVDGGIDSHYSEHVGRDMYHIIISWK